MIQQDQKIAIVTGGASGIGLAIAKEFVANNIFTIIIGRDQSKLDNAKQLLGDLCGTISFDLGKLEGIPALVERIVDEYGKIDILVNNAGINMKKEFSEVTDQDFMSIIQTNLLSVFAVSREVVKAMTPRQSGCIINISSMAAQYGIPKVIAYTASKTALDGMTKAMAVELSPKGIRINSIAPGFIATDMSAKALDSDPERKNKVMSRTPMGYMGEPKDIGTTAVFLASEGAKYITGTIIPVDGGNSVGF
ncbi:SDR family NAD(P)-dependent oxidoreductase [Desertivirga brevis]|uniref:SDR family NAD(P)-dependent oxidoreductase n=1 Tax=Desertivirga brevis TaxID=2810310 RepID=UPI001F600C47|nr:SDR family oxidoreductase [Pedobacter sp. SYSU D00873]